MNNNSAIECNVRAMVADDLEAVLEWRNHPEVARYMFTRHKITRSEHLDWFQHASQDPDRHLLIVEEADRPLGFAGFTIAGSKCVADWGFYTVPRSPRGTGRKLGNAVLGYAFARLTLHKVCGRSLAFNSRSIALHKALGFQHEGVLRDQHFDGKRYHDVILFGLLTREWSK